MGAQPAPQTIEIRLTPPPPGGGVPLGGLGGRRGPGFPVSPPPTVLFTPTAVAAAAFRAPHPCRPWSRRLLRFAVKLPGDTADMKRISRHDSHLAAPAANGNGRVARCGFGTQPFWPHAVFPRPPDLCGGREKRLLRYIIFF